jgi:isochorismate synthase
MKNIDTIFTEKPYTPDPEWPSYSQHESLLTTLRQASHQALTDAHKILVSFTQPVDFCDPLRIFSACQFLQMGEGCYWEMPAEQRAIVGVGVATSIETSGAASFKTAANAWRKLQRYTVSGSTTEAGYTGASNDTSGPILIGGFAFDPLHIHTDLWSAFPDGLLIVPSLLFHVQQDSATLTINRMLQPTDDIEVCADEMLEDMQRLYTAAKALPHEWLQEKASVPLSMHDLLPISVWKNLVAETAHKIQEGAYQKVVLARGVQATSATQPFDISATLQRLRESYTTANIFAIQRGEHYFVGATPERLLMAHDGQIQTMALAGSAPRGTTEEQDQHLGTELLHSEKNKIEHKIVVETLRNALAQICTEVWIADTPELLRLKNIQHLMTPIVGKLQVGHTILEAIQELHPTPAVSGFPREAALKEIREHEQLDRGWYAGPVGWIDANGNGEFAVALRSALINGHTATLFSGCGIVADSNPESEYVESCWKLLVMRRGLGEEEENGEGK